LEVDWKIKLLEVEAPVEDDNYWKRIYGQMKGRDVDAIDWVNLFIKNDFRMKPMDDNKWQSCFKDCQKGNYFRRKLIFIDQVPHGKYKDL
jgi:hypothetical protein